MHLVLFFLLGASVSFSQNTNTLAMKYNDSAAYIVNKYKDFEKGIYYIDKAIELDSNYNRLYENKLRFLMTLKRYDEANEVINKLIKLSNDNTLYISMSGLLLENKKDYSSAFLKYQEAERNYKTKQDATLITNDKYEFIVINRAMNLLFLREDSLAKQICIDYYENYKKRQFTDWLNRILSLTREYYFDLLLGQRK